MKKQPEVGVIGRAQAATTHPSGGRQKRPRKASWHEGSVKGGQPEQDLRGETPTGQGRRTLGLRVSTHRFGRGMLQSIITVNLTCGPSTRTPTCCAEKPDLSERDRYSMGPPGVLQAGNGTG